MTDEDGTTLFGSIGIKGGKRRDEEFRIEVANRIIIIGRRRQTITPLLVVVVLVVAVAVSGGEVNMRIIAC